MKTAAALALAALSMIRIAPAADCAGCHPAESKLHNASAHALALSGPKGSHFAERLPDHPLSEAETGFRFEYTRTEDGVMVTVQRNKDQITAALLWIFGSGRQGQTPVLAYRGHFIEHRVSYYNTAGFGITIGQQNGSSENARKALGWEQSTSDAKMCFGCHATVAKLDAKSPEFTNITPGVECVRCHPGAEEHADGRGKPMNPGNLNHLAQVQLCGECHRTKPPSGDDANIGNIRFQPLRLMKSACFRKSEISCLTCHDAHRDAVRNSDDTYNAICEQCHANQEAHIAQVRSRDCVTCHMPKASPAPGLSFTDHWIRKIGR